MYVYITHIIQFVFAIAGEEEQGPKSPDAQKKKKAFPGQAKCMMVKTYSLWNLLTLRVLLN